HPYHLSVQLVPWVLLGLLGLLGLVLQGRHLHQLALAVLLVLLVLSMSQLFASLRTGAGNNPDYLYSDSSHQFGRLPPSALPIQTASRILDHPGLPWALAVPLLLYHLSALLVPAVPL